MLKKSRSAFFIFALLISVFCQAVPSSLPLTSKAILLTVDQAIGPATEEYIEKGIATAKTNQAELIVLQLNTPGGIDTAMRGIIRAILNSPVPVITYVAPSGARAASAGTYILYASHLAAMAPGTNVGAATPINVLATEAKKTEAPRSVEEQKTQNDALAFLRSLAQLRGRNIPWTQQAITTSASLTASEALQKGVIDVIAVDIPDLLHKIDGRRVLVADEPQILHTDNLTVTTLKPDWRSQFLAIITNPNIAYILLLVGICGLFFEFLNPGFILPGVTGLISLLLAFYAFQLLPINYAGLGLILCGIAFLIGEIFFTSGILAVGGIIAFVIGSVFLLEKGIPGFSIALAVITAVSILIAIFFLFIVNLALRARFRPIVSGEEQLLESIGEVVRIDANQVLMRLRGELWEVKSDQPLRLGEKVIVKRREGLVLWVDPANNILGPRQPH